MTDQGRFADAHISQFEHQLLDKLPAWLRDAAGVKSGEGVQSSLAMWALRLGRSADLGRRRQRCWR